MVAQGEALDMGYLLLEANKLKEMEEAFDVCGGAFLRPVSQFLGTQFTYDELRLARIYLRQAGRQAE